MTLFLLDTNIFSYIAHGKSLAARAECDRYYQDPNSEVCISSITLGEIRYGMAKNQLSPRRVAAINLLVANLTIFPWSTKEAEVFGILRAKLESQGITVATMDLLIAAQAIAANATLVTHDAIFHRIPDLTTSIDWATDLP
jgi:tRNA(fMet)-specific endonuclease VapC